MYVENNLVRLIRLSTSEGRSLLIEPAEVLLLELRAMAKAAGDAKWDPDCDKKIILREVLRGWWEQRTDELIKGSARASGSKLAAKMRMAGSPDELVGLAVELRQGYAAASRTSRYFKIEAKQNVCSDAYKSEVVSLRARLIAGQLSLDGAGFHALCLDRMDAVNAERGPAVEDRSAFLEGFMYDIADRCLLKFERPV